ncbi:23454_t:CDS:2, partial [Gigaspora rosea]
MYLASLCQVAFEEPKGCTHQMFKKQVTVGLVESENEKTITNINSSINDSKNNSSDQIYIDPMGTIINSNDKNRQGYPKNKNNNYSGNGNDLIITHKIHIVIVDDPPDSNSINARLKDDDHHMGSSSQTSLSKASNKDFLDKISKLEADKKWFSEKVVSLESKVNYPTSRLAKECDNLKLSVEEERKERVSATHNCKVCFSEPITHAIYPCYHLALCGTCIEAVD